MNQEIFSGMKEMQRNRVPVPAHRVGISETAPGSSLREDWRALNCDDGTAAGHSPRGERSVGRRGSEKAGPVYPRPQRPTPVP